MAKTFDDAADIYPLGSMSTSGMLDGVWGNVSGDIVSPTFGARTGEKCFKAVSNGGDGCRFVLRNGPVTEVLLSVAIYRESLPAASNRIRIDFRDAGNASLASFMIDSAGIAHIQNPGGGSLAQSPSPVFTAGTWHWYEMRIVMAVNAATFELRDENENVLLSASGLALAGTAIGQIALVAGDQFTFDHFYFDDLVVKDATGSRMNTWTPKGGSRNYWLPPVADDSASGWDFVARKIFGDGVGYLPGGGAYFYQNDAAALEIGAGDFTVEGIFRWETLPSSGASYTLASKWRTVGNQAWRLRHYESAGARFLAFEISTDGSNLTAIHDFPFEPVPFHPYRIAVSRAGGVNRMFIDGVRKGPEVADANTYFNGTARAAIGALHDTSAPFNGWVDEFRLTVGVGRYTAEYTPATAKFPRDSSDTHWNNVQWLMGFDGGNAVDESQFARAITAANGATAMLTNDGDFAYQSIDKPGIDDTFVEAAYLPAKGTLEFTQQPADGQQVVLGTITYTYRNTLSLANDIKIGVDEEDSLDNLIAAINGDAGAGAKYGAGTVPNPDAIARDLPGAIMEAEAATAGTTGNLLAWTTTVTNAVISGAGTLTGGADIPTAGIYQLKRLPAGVTRIDSLTLRTRRSVFGVGSATIQPAIQDSSLTISSGADTAAPANPSWQSDQFDSNGGLAWTPAALIGAKARVNRTS